MKYFSSIVSLVVLTLLVIVFSALFSSIWNSESVKLSFENMKFSEEMSLQEFSENNEIPLKVITQGLKLKSEKEIQKKIKEFNLKEDEFISKIKKAYSIYSENSKKNWIKIVIKFTLWILFLILIFFLLRKKGIATTPRLLIYLGSSILFGSILGADPSAMGTIKDAIILFCSDHTIFVPRLIAMSIFLILSIIGNKLFCGWACQLGVFQDIIFRLNRNKKDTKSLTKQFKIPFLLTNSIRFLVFIAIIIFASIFSVDIFSSIDPFKIFNPELITLVGFVFIGILLLLSLFIYRPWCHLFCPFGLVSWIFEQISIFKIKINPAKCIGCKACVRACPSDAMKTIYFKNKIKADCFSCSTCINICPKDAISFTSKKYKNK